MASMTIEPDALDDLGDDSVLEHAITLDEVDQASDGESDDEDYNPNDDLINDLSLDVEDDNDRIKTPRDLEVEAAATWVTIAAEDMLCLVSDDVEGTSRWAGWKAAFRGIVENAKVQRETVVLAAKVCASAAFVGVIC
jgi:hypothetical protein